MSSHKESIEQVKKEAEENTRKRLAESKANAERSKQLETGSGNTQSSNDKK